MNSIFRSLRPITRFLSYGPRVRPSRDWFVLLALFTVLMFGSVLWNLVQFSHVLEGQQIGNGTVATSTPINLNTVQALFTQRADERVRYQSQYRFVDPSL